MGGSGKREMGEGGRVTDGVLVSPLHSYSKMRFPYLRDERFS